MTSLEERGVTLHLKRLKTSKLLQHTLMRVWPCPPSNCHPSWEDETVITVFAYLRIPRNEEKTVRPHGYNQNGEIQGLYVLLSQALPSEYFMCPSLWKTSNYEEISGFFSKENKVIILRSAEETLKRQNGKISSMRRQTKRAYIYFCRSLMKFKSIICLRWEGGRQREGWLMFFWMFGVSTSVFGKFLCVLNMCEGNYNWSIDDLLTKNRAKAVKIFVT